MNNTIQFGQHLTIDGYGGDYDLLNDYNLVLKILNELPEKISMQKMCDPLVEISDGNNQKDPGGVTGIVLIKQSHISIHTFSKRRFVSVDVYTCTDDLDVDFIIQYIKDNFKLEDVETHHIKRGTRYPAQNIV